MDFQYLKTNPVSVNNMFYEQFTNRMVHHSVLPTLLGPINTTALLGSFSQPKDKTSQNTTLTFIFCTAFQFHYYPPWVFRNEFYLA